MPSPAQGDLHVNTLLTNVSVAFLQDEADYVADDVFPSLSVQKQSDLYAVYNKDDFFRDEVKERSPGTESVGIGYHVDLTQNYFARKYAAHKDVDDPSRANADSLFDLDRDSTKILTQKMLIRRENIWATNYFTTGVWTGAASGNDQVGVNAGPGADQFLRWNVAGSTPVEDIDAKIIDMAEQTGKRPNKLVLGPRVYNVLKNHAEFLDRIKYTQRGVVTPEIMASVFGVDKVLVPFATNNTAAEGAAGTYSLIFGKSALLLYSAPNPGIMTPSAGYTFSWTGLFGAAGSMGFRIKRFRLEQLESDRIEIESAFDMKVISAPLGIFFSTAVA